MIITWRSCCFVLCTNMIDSYFTRKETKRKHGGETLKHVYKESQLNVTKDRKCKKADNNVWSFMINSDLMWEKITKENLDLDYVQLFNKREADLIFQACEKEIRYDARSQVRVFGKWHDVPRQQTAYGDDGLKYTFSGATVGAKPWTMAPVLKEINDIITSVTGHVFNFVLVNRYKDGNDYMGEHQDKETDLIPGGPIASLSLGQARDFVFRHRDARGSGAKQKIDPVKLELRHGSLLMMNHPTNHFWYHSLPKRKKALAARINLTFRQMVVVT